MITLGASCHLRLPAIAGTAAVDGPAASATFGLLSAIARANGGTIFLADDHNRTIRKLAGASSAQSLELPSAEDALTASGPARAWRAARTALAPSGLLWIVDSRCNTIRTLDASGQVTTVAGVAGAVGNADGLGTAARFSTPGAMVINNAGVVFLCDSFGTTIRRIAPDRTVTTLAPRFSSLRSLALDLNGDIIAATFGSVHRVTASGDATILGGSLNVPLSPVSIDGVGVDARFSGLAGITVSPSGVIFVGDARLIRRGHPELLTLPTVLAHPSPQTKFIGAPAQFTIQVSGIPQPALQWEMSTNGGRLGAGHQWRCVFRSDVTGASDRRGHRRNGRIDRPLQSFECRRHGRQCSGAPDDSRDRHESRRNSVWRQGQRKRCRAHSSRAPDNYGQVRLRRAIDDVARVAGSTLAESEPRPVARAPPSSLPLWAPSGRSPR